MFDRLIAFIRDLPAADAGKMSNSDQDPRVAAAALMFHVMDADGIRDAVEQERLSKALEETFSVSGEELKELLHAGEAADRDAIDLYAFTSVLKRHLDADSRVNFIRIMWQIAYADGERHELEENIVWRVAELIGVERAERIAMRQQAESAAGLGSEE